ncbi:hypothetical protein HZA76_02885 [Candidatus Roizmanbacteria bacterium]|nr:hypothetical protein [Candidatus Roizmanbacteria bacterium]
MKNNLILIIILILLAAGGGFYGGIKYQQSRRVIFSGQFGNGQFMMRNGQGIQNGSKINRGGFKPVAGEIISSDENSVTVKLQDGSSKIVILSDKTEINKAEKVEKSELKSGTKVAVFGTENSDGSVSALNIQVNPTLKNQSL